MKGETRALNSRPSERLNNIVATGPVVVYLSVASHASKTAHGAVATADLLNSLCSLASGGEERWKPLTINAIDTDVGGARFG